MSQKHNPSINNSNLDTTIGADVETHSKPLVPNDNPQAIYDNKNLQWSFMRKTVGALLLLNIGITIFTHYFCYNKRAFKNFLRGYTDIEAYPIICIILLALIYIFAAAFPKIASNIKFGLIIPIYALALYLWAFTLNYFSKEDQDSYDKFISAISIFFCGSFGVFMALLFNKNEISMGIAVTVSLIAHAVQEVMLTYVYEIHFPQLW